MKSISSNTFAISASMAILMAATRFHHFGSAFSLPDASLAVFFLGGYYLARYSRASLAVFAVLIIEAGLIDYYATTAQGVSDWCMTPAYWFLIPTYGSLWLAGRWVALRNSMKQSYLDGTWLPNLALVAWAAISFAFVFSNATFYLFSGRFTGMTMGEYSVSVAEYYVSYVLFALLYISCAIAMQMVIEMIGRQRIINIELK